MSLLAIASALRRRPVLLLFLHRARPEAALLLGLVLFMLVLVPPLARAVLPEPDGPSLLGYKLGNRDPYLHHRGWLEPILWLGGLGAIAFRTRRRLVQTAEDATTRSQALAEQGEAALLAGEKMRSVALFQEAAELAIDGERRSVLLGRTLGGESKPAARTLVVPRSPSTIGAGGRIQLVRRLGEGGMGVVHLGEDRVLGRRLAVKELSSGAAGDGQARERFLREAQALAQLSSPHVVQVYDLVEQDGKIFLCMELCEGHDLGKELSQRGRFSPKEIVSLGAQIARALAAAHDKGIVHRDLKPANVLFSAPGVVKVADFGLAKLETSGLTQEGTIMGTPCYMAPEQVLGKPCDARTDLYALGCVLFELAAGAPPYTGSFTEVVAQHTSPAAPPAPDAPAGLAAIITALMQKAPEARPDDAAKVAEQLLALSFDDEAPVERTMVRGKKGPTAAQRS